MPETTVTVEHKKLLDALYAGNAALFQQTAAEMHYADLATIYEDLEEEHRETFSSFLGAEKFAEIIADIPDTLVEDAMEGFSEADQREILDAVSDDDRVDLLQDVSDSARRKYLDLLDEDDKEVTNTLLKYGEETAGGRMTTHYGQITQDMTVKEAIDTLRSVSEETETLARIFVVDHRERLVGKLRLRELAFNNWDTLIADIVEPVEHSLLASADQEEASQMFLKYDMIVLPVVDEQDRLLGVITHDDAMEIFEEESTEDIEKMAGVAGEQSEETYLNTDVMEHFKRRFPWLLILALLAITSGFVMLKFEHVLSSIFILALYLPMVVAAGGNTGGQAATMVIRAMALGELHEGTSMRVAWKEARLGLLLGCLLGACIATITLFVLPMFNLEMPSNMSYGLFAAAVAIALTAQIITSTLTGALLPIFARKANIDPAVVAAPAITTIVDVSGMVIYFLVASAMLPV